MTQAYSVCPKCSHTRKKSNDKCLSTNTETGVFKCHHCGHSGRIGDNNMLNKSNTNANQEFKKPVLRLPSTNLPENVIKFFKTRGVLEDILKRNKIGFQNGSITFPYFKEGELVNTKYRTLDKQFRQESGAEKVFYGLDDINGHEEVVIVEGEIDKLSFEVAGPTNVLSVPDGAPALNAKSYESKFSYIENCEKELEGVKK